jgi:DNA-binding NarL/FixJ family response regulator
MSPVDGIEATRRMVARHPELKVLGLTSHDDPELIAALIDAGARGCVLKGGSLADLLHAVGEVAAGRPCFSPQLGQLFPHSPHSSD